ncbi:hypothetical protein Mapa_008959 [Marchantia paleacea]|nr:hypothetical protein Mapa_008959 [Marchantia paleacea]
MAIVSGALAVTKTTAESSASVSRSSVSCYASSSHVLFKRTVFGATLRTSNDSRRGSLRLQPLVVRATSSYETMDPSKQLDEIVGDLKAKWDAIENKSVVAVY